MNIFKKSDRVVFNYQGERLHATVLEVSETNERLHLRIDGWASTDWVQTRIVEPE